MGPGCQRKVLMHTAWQIPGMDSFWNALVGESSAPVGANTIRRHRPSRSPESRYPLNTEAEQPQPEPPQ